MNRDQGDPVALTVPMLDWLIGWALTGMRSSRATAADYARLDAVQQRKRDAAFAVAFKRHGGGPIQAGWVNLRSVAEGTGISARTLQRYGQTGAIAGQPIRAEKLDGYYFNQDDLRKALER